MPSDLTSYTENNQTVTPTVPGNKDNVLMQSVASRCQDCWALFGWFALAR